MVMVILRAGGRSCAKARRAFAEKFGLRRKLSPYIRYFVAILRFLQLTHFLNDFGQKKCFFRVETMFSGQEFHITWYILHIVLD